MSRKTVVVLSLILVAAVAIWLMYNYLTWEGYSGWTTAKEAFSIASSYALSGEPDAQLEEIVLSGGWRPEEETVGKSSAWTLTFCAPDGARIDLEVEKKTLFVRHPWDGPASDKKSSDLWEEARSEGHTKDFHPIEGWVDSVGVFEDALTRAKEDLGDDLLLESVELKCEADYFVMGQFLKYERVWVVFFWEGMNARRGRGYYYGREYIYDCADGSWLNTIIHTMTEL